MSLTRLSILSLIVFTSYTCVAQADSALQQIQEVPKKYITAIDTKIDKYQHGITNKTEKTLTKLARWENKIKNLLEKASPETAQRLFGEGKITFKTLLEKYKNGEKLVADTREKYNEYQDKLITGFSYLAQQKENIDAKLIAPIQKANAKVKHLDTVTKQQEAVEVFIKERRRELINEAIKYIGKSKYITKINSESVYYMETIQNYKEIFSDAKKAEQTALTILHKIPAFNKFIEENSMLASLFGTPANMAATQSLAGLQTRASVNALIQNQILAGGPNAAAQMQQNLQQAQSELNKIKDKVIKMAEGGGSGELPIKNYNPERIKTFKQRLEFNTNLQFNKAAGITPTISTIGVTVGYRITPKWIVGLGGSYKLGLGSIQKIRFSHEGVGIRSNIDYKLKHQFYLTGGMEMNYNSAFKEVNQLQSINIWQKSMLLGLSKKINIKTKLTKGTTLQLLYDAFARQQTPATQEWIFRIGYKF
jgi:hypothetical protein